MYRIVGSVLFCHYLFSVVFCTEPYGHQREYVQTLCTLSVLHFLCYFRAGYLLIVVQCTAALPIGAGRAGHRVYLP